MIITAGIYKGRKLLAPDENITRPTLSKVRMGVFNTLYSIIGEFEGKSFLDLFGGSGIMGLEALSRGFERVKVFEKNIKAAQIIKKNYEKLSLKPDLVIGDSEKLIFKTEENFDVIYIDPPYKSGIYEDILMKLRGKLGGKLGGKYKGKSPDKNVDGESSENLPFGKILIVEHSESIDFAGFDIIKQKNYGGKNVTFLLNDEFTEKY